MKTALPLAVCCLLLAACASASPTGTISGHLFAVGGPAPGAPRPLPGTVSIAGAKNIQVSVGADGIYSVSVPAGRYVLTGRSPLYNGGGLLCRAASPVTVVVGQTVTADVLCQER